MKTVKGRRPSPDNPWAECLTGILSCGGALEKFSWCFKPGNFRMNGIAVYRDSRILLFCVRKGPVIFLYCWLALDLCAPVGYANESRQGLKKSTTTPADAPNPSKQ